MRWVKVKGYVDGRRMLEALGQSGIPEKTDFRWTQRESSYKKWVIFPWSTSTEQSGERLCIKLKGRRSQGSEDPRSRTSEQKSFILM